MYSAMDGPTEQEDDLLDLASGITETSRLGCQIRVSETVDGLEVRLPGIVQDQSGH